MATIDMIQRWKRIITMAEQRNTGKSKEFARHLGTSKVTLYKDIRLINIIIEEGLFTQLNFPISYNRKLSSYEFQRRKKQKRQKNEGFQK